MPRLFVISIPGHDVETLATSDLVANRIIIHDNQRHKETLLAQIRSLNTGDTAYLTGGISVQVIGHGDEEDPPPPPPELPEIPGGGM